MTSGLIACAVALALALALGVAWRWNNGRMRDLRPGSRLSARVSATAHSAAVSGVSGVSGSAGPGPRPRSLVTVAELGQPLGSHATLLQFSSAFCAPCRATRRILGEVAGMTDGVAHVEIDAESRLDLVRLMDVRRTPTVFVLGPDGRIAKRASGQPRKADVIAALGAVT